jgi:hypothetical protein
MEIIGSAGVDCEQRLTHADFRSRTPTVLVMDTATLFAV